ncbi:MAG: YidB family protein [Pseudomonadota bacterium]
MGLFDSVLGAVMNGQQAQAGSGGGLGGLGNIGNLLNMVTSNPQLLQAIAAMLSNDGAQGGLGGLIAKFQQAGLGDVVGSWIGTGQNQNVSGEQLTSVLGEDTMAGLAEKLGISPEAAAGQLSNILPGLIDQLTPQGQAPAGGLGNSGDLMGMLGGLLSQR